MACGFCLAARKRAVRVFYKKPGSKACQKARAALERLLGKGANDEKGL